MHRRMAFPYVTYSAVYAGAHGSLILYALKSAATHTFARFLRPEVKHPVWFPTGSRIQNSSSVLPTDWNISSKCDG